MGYIRFDNLNEANAFVQVVNDSEEIGLEHHPERATTSYCQPIERNLAFYVLADAITTKYTNADVVDIPPNLTIDARFQ